jgi:uncharacterized protein
VTGLVTQLRLLAPEDVPALERFRAVHRDGSMFLRSNLRRVGVVYRDAPWHATYVGAFDGDELAGVVAHGWNGMLLVQTPTSDPTIARECVARSGRKVTGLSGPLEHVRCALAALGMEQGPFALNADERLYALSLDELIVPADLPGLECRPPRADERDRLLAFRVAYDIETLGGTDSDETRARAAGFLDAQLADGNAWVAVSDGQIVSLSAFNAALPDIVQLGGIYTPPVERGRGFARAAVAAALVAARARGASRAVLFTQNPSAIRCYEALGFRRVGDYGLVLLR